MITENLFSKNRVRVINLLTEHLQDLTDPYALTVTKFDISVQGCFSPKLMSALRKKRFNPEVQESGHLYMSKTIGGVYLRFIFTD
jgi:hypothetical protein